MSRRIETTPYLFVTVDETGNPGERQKGSTHYIMAGCLVNDKDAFATVTEKRREDVELKFYTHKYYRIPVIKEARDYVDRVYYVDFCKPRGWHSDKNNKEELVELHKSLLQSLVRGIANDNPRGEIEMIIDHTELISDTVAENIAMAEGGPRVRINPDAKDSKEDFGLMTNDFFVGAIGYMVNTPYDRKRPGREYTYSNLFSEKIVRVPYREFKEVVRSNNVGNPGRHYPAAAGATQTSYGLPTNSPTRGLIGRTNVSKSSNRYKIPGQKGTRRLERVGTQERRGLFGRRKSMEKKIGSERR